MVFSPAPHWLLCTGPSFDINWVKHEGGREGGQQLDPTVNVTLVSQLHRCQSLAFRFISLFCPCTPLNLCVFLKMPGTLRPVYWHHLQVDDKLMNYWELMKCTLQMNVHNNLTTLWNVWKHIKSLYRWPVHIKLKNRTFSLKMKYKLSLTGQSV